MFELIEMKPSTALAGISSLKPGETKHHVMVTLSKFWDAVIQFGRSQSRRQYVLNELNTAHGINTKKLSTENSISITAV